jgi:tRNA-dihydrouridine synthase B
MQLGPFIIDSPFILAPMAAITNSPYRRLMRSLGSGLVISELVSANEMAKGGKRTLDLLNYSEDERIVGIQIYGENLANLCWAAKTIQDRGVDFIDLNLGCPVRKVVNRGAGSGMCRDLNHLSHVLASLVQSVSIPLTIKIRTGWDEKSKNVLDVVRVAADAGVAWVAIHGRTRAQGYEGLADWDLIGEVKAASSIPIIGNGDILSPEGACSSLNTYGVDAVMIGRGALKNPFIFRQALAMLKGDTYSAPILKDYLDLFRIQKDYLEESFDKRRVFLNFRKFVAWYGSVFPGGHEFRKRVFQIGNFDEMWTYSQDFFRRSFDRPANQLNSLLSKNRPAESFLMGGHG